MITEAVRITGEGITISQLVWRKFKRRKPGFVEQVIEINPGLGSLPVFLPVGTVVLMPMPDASVRVDEAAIALWD